MSIAPSSCFMFSSFRVGFDHDVLRTHSDSGVASSCLHAMMPTSLPCAVLPSLALAALRFLWYAARYLCQLKHHRFLIGAHPQLLQHIIGPRKPPTPLGSYICSTQVGLWSLRISLLSAPWPLEDRYTWRLLMKDHPFLLGHAYYYNILLGCFGDFWGPKLHQKWACLVLFCSRTRNWSLSVIMGSLKNILWFQRPILAVRASLDPCYNIIKL